MARLTKAEKAAKAAANVAQAIARQAEMEAELKRRDARAAFIDRFKLEDGITFGELAELASYRYDNAKAAGDEFQKVQAEVERDFGRSIWNTLQAEPNKETFDAAGLRRSYDWMGREKTARETAEKRWAEYQEIEARRAAAYEAANRAYDVIQSVEGE